MRSLRIRFHLIVKYYNVSIEALLKKAESIKNGNTTELKKIHRNPQVLEFI